MSARRRVFRGIEACEESERQRGFVSVAARSRARGRLASLGRLALISHVVSITDLLPTAQIESPHADWKYQCFPSTSGSSGRPAEGRPRE